MNRALAGVLVCAFLLPVAFSRADAPDFFNSNYLESRDRFRQSCREAAAKVPGQCRYESVESLVDPDLTIDYGYFSKNGSRLLVIQSGIHGPEAPAGAAVQELFLKKYLIRYLGRGIDVLLIHSLNPYGFKYWRRADEYNVNLNRNFLKDAAAYNVKNQAYADLRYVFEPQSQAGSVAGDSFLTSLKFLWAYALSKFDKRQINQAMNSGQYEFPKGINYGGHAQSEQVKFLNRILTPLFAKHSGQILFLDFHTGLGEDGVLQIMNGLKPPKDFLAKMKNDLGSLSSEGIKMTDPNDTGNGDFFTDLGDVIDFVPGLASDQSRVLALTMEYGTMGVDTLNQLKTADRIVLENQAHFFGCTSEKTCEQVQRNFQDLFDPSDPAWRQAVIKEADRVFSILAGKL